MTRDSELAATVTIGASLLMVAAQVAGKATRAAFYLTNFDASTLPLVIAGSAVLSLISLPLASRLMSRFGPLRMLPVGFTLSAGLLGVEWLASNPLW